MCSRAPSGKSYRSAPRRRTYLLRCLRARLPARRLLQEAHLLPELSPEILFVQTFGDRVNFNPHRPVLAADGAFLPDERFVALPMERSPPLDFASGPPSPSLPLTYPPVPDLA